MAQDHFWLWTTSLLVFLVVVFAAINGTRYYLFRSQGNATGPTGAEVFWVAPSVLDCASPNTCNWLTPGGWSPKNPKPTAGAGYSTYSNALNMGALATYAEIKDAFQRGLTVNRWGFFDGQCGTALPGNSNPRGRFCAINCCQLGSTCGPLTKGHHNKPQCSSPSGSPSGGDPCCVGNVPATPTDTSCQACFSPDASLGSPLQSCTAWYPERDGLFVACPQASKGASPVPEIPGGPWDHRGKGGPHQPRAHHSNVNAYQINTKPTLAFGTQDAPAQFKQTTGMSSMSWNYYLGNESNTPGGKQPSNPWAGALVYGVKPTQGSQAAQGVLPFDVTTGQWNDPQALKVQQPGSFQLFPDSQIILFLVILGLALLVIGLFWFRQTRLGEALLYWV